MTGSRRHTFDRDAERYAVTRPTYPPALFDAVAEYGDLGTDARVLEVGPGTGQATRSLAERGWTVTAVELGASLAAVAKRNLEAFPQIDIVVDDFDRWQPTDARFDLFFCATAFHWLDPSTRVARAAGTVREGGSVGIVWTHHVTGGTEGFFAATRECYERFDPDTPKDQELPAEDALEPATAELLNSPLLTDVEDHRFPVEIEYATADYLALLQTYSNILSLSADQRANLLDCIGHVIDEQFSGRVTKRYLFELVLARRTEATAAN
ncbi:class I SAM-dependent methyltransferase [Leifsonia poae]|uniref:class I SAM-dependent methyltransferase n=1 Tax=Leifsonia poae TaxID=110933 RepID=UPI003D67B646